MRTINATRIQPLKKSLGLLILLAGGFVGMNRAQAQISGASATIIVNDTSITPTAVNASATAICNGGSTQLQVQGGELGTGASWKWYQGGCGTGASIGTGPSITVSPANTGTADITTTYYVRAEGGACNYTTGCAQVTITTHPTPAVTPVSDVVYCFGQTPAAVAIAGTPSNVVFDISGGSSVGLSNQAGVNAVPSFTTINPGNTPLVATVIVTPKANGCTGTPDTFTITVLPQVSVNPTADLVVCNGLAVNVPAFTGSPSGNTYSWTNSNTGIGLSSASGNGNISSFNGLNTSCTDAVATFVVTPSFTSSSLTCPGTADTFTVTVHPTPNGTLAGGTICEGQQAQLTFNASCGLAPFNLEIKPASAPSATPYNGINSGTPFDVTPTPTTTTTYYLMKITDANGCVRQ